MKGLVVLLSLFLLTAAERQDLSGKMFTFPVESNTHHVILTPEVNKAFTALTVCLRAFSDISRAQSPFSVSLPSKDNAFLIFKEKQGVYHFFVLNQFAKFYGLSDELNVWNSVCATWDIQTGLGQLWVNGNPSSRKGIKGGGPFTGTPKIILGQDQDNYGGGFDVAQSFVGMLSDVHMWDYVLSPDQIAYYSNGDQFQPGNVLNWNSLEFTINGNVAVENLQVADGDHQDLSGKMFTFPVESNTHHVVLSPKGNKIFTAITVCLRAFSDISRAQSLFSLSLPSPDNAFVIYKEKQGLYHLYVLKQYAVFYGLSDESNIWNSVCATWDSKTGLGQLWVNGKPSSRKGINVGGSLTGSPKIILGQEQDTYGGDFNAEQSFVGMLSDVHMWDYVLSPDQIAHYLNGDQFQPGNILKWNSLEFTINGNVVVESKKTSYKK